MLVEIKLLPFTVPNCVISDKKIDPNNSSSFSVYFKLEELTEKTLSDLCNEFRRDVFKRAGKVDPNETK